MAVVYLPPAQLVFKTSGLKLEELIVALTLPWVVPVAVEIEKWLVRRGHIHRDRPQVRGRGTMDVSD